MKELEKQIKDLKKEIFDLEKTSYHEKEALIGLINTLTLAASKYPGLSDELKSLQNILNYDQELDTEALERQVSSLKTKLLASEVEAISPEDISRLKELKDTVVLACRALRKIIISVTEDLYPLDSILSERAFQIDITCGDQVRKEDFEAASREFLDFVRELRRKIEQDFKYINGTFRVFLDQIKELEKTLTSEYGGEERLKEIEYFEMNINEQMSSIVQSFDIHTTIDEIKQVVTEKIRKIKEVVSLRKKQEMERARATKENMERLQQRIAEAERQAQEMSRRAEELKTVAMKDGLTGLYNRKAFELRISSTLNRAKESREPFCLIMFDVDGFKEINDAFGHVAGDKVLRKVAECLKGSFRENDFIARYGGDEFAAIIERMDRPMALERLEAFKKNLSKIRFVSHKKGELRITVSSGVAEATGEDTPDTIVERADEEMYKEKNAKKKSQT